MWAPRFLKKVGATVSRSFLQTFSLGLYQLPEKPASIADGEEVLLANFALYNRKNIGKGSCLLVLTSKRLAFATVFDSRGFPSKEHVNSIPVDEIDRVSYEKSSLLGRIVDGRLAQKLAVRRPAGDELIFSVDDARRWFDSVTDRSSSQAGDT
jgi:hypothetical protein